MGMYEGELKPKHYQNLVVEITLNKSDMAELKWHYNYPYCTSLGAFKQ